LSAFVVGMFSWTKVITNIIQDDRCCISYQISTDFRNDDCKVNDNAMSIRKRDRDMLTGNRSTYFNYFGYHFW